MMDPGFGFSSFENTFAIVLVIVVIGFIVVIGSFIVMAVRGTEQSVSPADGGGRAGEPPH